jgi:hypothetical protein
MSARERGVRRAAEDLRPATEELDPPTNDSAATQGLGYQQGVRRTTEELRPATRNSASHQRTPLPPRDSTCHRGVRRASEELRPAIQELGLPPKGRLPPRNFGLPRGTRPPTKGRRCHRGTRRAIEELRLATEKLRFSTKDSTTTEGLGCQRGVRRATKELWRATERLGPSTEELDLTPRGSGANEEFGEPPRNFGLPPMARCSTTEFGGSPKAVTCGKQIGSVAEEFGGPATSSATPTGSAGSAEVVGCGNAPGAGAGSGGPGALRYARRARSGLLPLGSVRGQLSIVGGVSIAHAGGGRLIPPRATAIPGARFTPTIERWTRCGRSTPPASARPAARSCFGRLVAGAAAKRGTGRRRWSGMSAARPPPARREGAPDEDCDSGKAERIPLIPSLARGQSATTRSAADLARAPWASASRSASWTVAEAGICQPQTSGRTRQCTTPCCTGVGGSGT